MMFRGQLYKAVITQLMVVVKSCSSVVILKNTVLSYLSHRHAAHTGVQHTRPCICAHLTDEREPLFPADTVEMD